MHPTVRVATWNCFGAIASLRGFLAASPVFPRRLRARAIRSLFARCDVVCVQENWLPFVTDALEEAAELAELHFWHDRADAPTRSPFGGGLAILARAPIRARFVPFESAATGFDRFADKGFAIAEVRLPGRAPLRVVNVHMQADDPRHDPPAFRRARAAQIEALVAAAKPNGMPTIVAGDLNVAEGSAEYDQVLRPALETHGFVDHGAGRGLHTFDVVRNDLLRHLEPHDRHGPRRLDYLWSAAGQTTELREKSAELCLHEPIDEETIPGARAFASDHFGLEVELELVTKPGTDLSF